MSRELPDIETIANDLARELGGEAHRVEGGEWPSFAIAFDGSHRVLVRDHKWSITLSLPRDKSWHARTHEELAQATAEIPKALWQEKQPKVLAMADVILAIRPMLEGTWEVSFPGTPVPSEVWIRKADSNIGLFQEPDLVRLIVWGSSDHMKFLKKPSDCADLAEWLPRAIVEQEADAALKAAEVARKKALPLPKFEDVIAALRAGRTFQTGGGRWHQTFSMVDGKLQCEIFDEGYTEVAPTDEASLIAAISNYPDDFRR